MSEYGDYSGDEYEQDWLYVEDHYDEADNLAEHTCPSPVYQFNIDEDFGDYDPYDYWEDLTYLSDSYHDGKTKPRPKAGDQKRKTTTDPSSRPKKRRRKDAQGKMKIDQYSNAAALVSQEPPVVWVTNRERDLIAQMEGVPVKQTSGKVISLLKDWKERFKDAPGFETNLDFKSDDGDATDNVSVEGDGFGLDVSSVAQILSNGDSMDQLKSMLEAQGLDPKVIEVAMRDIVEGKEYEGDQEDTDDEQGGPAGGGDGPRDIIPNGRFANPATEIESPAIPNGEFKSNSSVSPPKQRDISKMSTKRSPPKSSKRARAATLPDENEAEEPIAKRSRRKKVNYAGMA